MECTPFDKKQMLFYLSFHCSSHAFYTPPSVINDYSPTSLFLLFPMPPYSWPDPSCVKWLLPYISPLTPSCPTFSGNKGVPLNMPSIVICMPLYSTPSNNEWQLPCIALFCSIHIFILKHHTLIINDLLPYKYLPFHYSFILWSPTASNKWLLPYISLHCSHQAYIPWPSLPG